MSNFSASYAAGVLIALTMGLLLFPGGPDTRAAVTATIDRGAAAPETLAATFYVIILMLLLIIGFIAVAAGQRIWVPYVGLGIAGLVWLGLNDQVSRNTFVPGLQISARSIIIYGFAYAGLNFIVAALSIAREPAHRQRRVQLFATAIIALLAIAITWFVPLNLAAFVMYVFVIAASLSHNIAVRTFPQFGRDSDRYDQLGMMIFMAALILVATVIILGFFASSTNLVLLTRILIVGFVLFGGFMALYRVLATTREREEALGEALAAAKRDATMSRALLEAERNYAAALDVAGVRAQQLATASHDIKQPLASLRTTIDVIASGEPPDVQAQLRKSFDYLDQLATSYISKAREDGTVPDDAPPDALTRETITASLLLGTLERMFRAEAEHKGLGFTVAETDAVFQAQPLSVMRILSNLVANAINHADVGAVELSARETKACVIFCVRNSGAAFAGGDMEQFFDKYTKGDASAGEGLGLAIVKSLAEEVGMTVSFHRDEEKDDGAAAGYQFNLSIPRTGPAVRVQGGADG